MLTQNDFNIIVTGERPGAGQSTTAKLLTDYGLQRVYAGSLLRQFAQGWKQKKQEGYSWEEYEQAIATGTLSIEDIAFTEDLFDEETILNFEKEVEKHGGNDLWDKIVDTNSMEALLKPGVVVEAKIGVVLHKSGLPVDIESTAHNNFKILLLCDADTAAERIIKRKITTGEIDTISPESPEYEKLIQTTKADAEKRRTLHWNRYTEIYGLTPDMLYEEADLTIDTRNKDQEEVVAEIISFVTSH